MKRLCAALVYLLLSGAVIAPPSTAQEAPGIITTIAGNGRPGFSGDGGPATQASLNQPKGLAVDAMGNIYFSDSMNSRIRRISVEGLITTIAGNGLQGFSGDGGPATQAGLSGAWWVAVDGQWNVYIGDRGNNRIRRVSPDGVISTFAGTGTGWPLSEGAQALNASLSAPRGLALDTKSLYEN